MRRDDHFARMGERKGAYRISLGKLGRKKSLGRPKCRWEDNIKMDFQEEGWGKNLINLAEDTDRCQAVVNAVMNLRVP